MGFSATYETEVVETVGPGFVLLVVFVGEVLVGEHGDLVVGVLGVLSVLPYWRFELSPLYCLPVEAFEKWVGFQLVVPFGS
mgnify:CR=1 FL=1